MHSETDRGFCAQLVANAFLREIAGYGQPRRLYLAGLLDLEPAEVFASLAQHLELDDPPVTVTSRDGATHALQAINLEKHVGAGGFLVPYMVGDDGSQPNVGSAGFAAFLRDALPGTHRDRPVSLLVLDPLPVETVRTAAQDAAELPSLGWGALVDQAMQGAAPPIAALLSEAVHNAGAVLPRTAATVGTLRRLSEAGDAATAGRDLHRLGAFVSDPGAAGQPRRRLRDNARWRQRLDDWSSYDQDFEGKLSDRYPGSGHPGLRRVLAARGPFGLDYAAFTYDDLPTRPEALQHARLATPISVRNAAAATALSSAAVWLPGGGTLAIRLAHEATAEETAHVRWRGGGEDVPVRPGDLELAINVSGDGPAWRYATVRMATGQMAHLAVWTGHGPWMPVEAHLDIDANAGAFTCPETPQVLSLDANGSFVGQAQLATVPPADGETYLVDVSLDGSTAALHLLVLATAGSEEDGDDGDGEGADTEADADSDGDGDGDGDEDEASLGIAVGAGGGTSPAQRRAVASGPHAALMGSADGTPHAITDFRILEDGRGKFDPGTFFLEDQDINGIDGLKIERHILANPDVLAFSLIRRDGTVRPEPHPYLDGLDLGGVPAGPLAAFMRARRDLFAALLSTPERASVHACGAGLHEQEARAYVQAYLELIASVAGEGRFQPEHEAVLLVDTVTDTGGDWWIAPTSPLAVAYLLEFKDASARWASDAPHLLKADLDTCTPRHLLSTFHSQGVWYSDAPSPALLWRRYRPIARTDPGESRPGYISRRIRHFLDVHPAYRDPRQQLAVAFIEPGDGRAALEALRAVVRPLTKSEPRLLPRLAVTIVSSSESPTLLEDVLRGGTAGRRTEAEEDRVLRDRATLQRLAPSDELPFQHITFLFQTSLQEEPAAVDLEARASTLYAGGLAAAPGRLTHAGRNEMAFHWGTFAPADGNRALVAITRHALELVGGMPREPLEPGRTRMATARIGQRELAPLYAASAWVVHLDRLLGLEAFTPDGSGAQARYLIDYEDRSDPGQPGLDAITATARISPYRMALRQALADIGTPTERALDQLLQLFNGVSGRWALDLVGANHAQLRERVGLAAALALTRDLDGWHAADAVSVIVPLDEVIDALPVTGPGGERCDDLLFLRVPLDATSGQPLRIDARLLEVKYRESNDPAAAQAARRQLESSHAWLGRTFNADGCGRPFRARDLAELLRGAATRSSAFGLLRVASVSAWEAALDRIVAGEYQLHLEYTVDGVPLVGDFIGIEPTSAVPVHRQPLAGSGLPLGHVRLGRPALEALASGTALTRPAGWKSPTFGPAGGAQEPPDQEEGAEGPSSPPREPGGGSGRGAPPAGPSPSSEAASQDPGAGPASPLVPDAPERALIATRLDEAFVKYSLAVEPFLPELAQVGPSVIRFRTRTIGRLTINEIERKARDIGREIAVPGEVHVGDEPGFVTIDVPRAERQPLPLAALLPALDARRPAPGALEFIAGMAPSGSLRIEDLSRLPHLLVAGATGSGKSVFLRGLLVELLRARTADELQLLIIDPKRLDFTAFTSAPHLRGGAIISDPDEAVEALAFTLESEIAQRQPILEAAGVSSAAEYYEAGGSLADLPQLVILVDEFADLVLAGTDPRAFSELVQRYAQLTRAYGIFLVLATQRPSVNVVTGSIKANLTARIAFSLPSARDSMTVIDKGGAEDLLGHGDMLFYRNGRLERLQAPFATLHDVRAVTG